MTLNESVEIHNADESSTAHVDPIGEVVAEATRSAILPHPQQSQDYKRSKRSSVYANLSYVPGVKIRLFSPPRQRQKWGSDYVLPHVNWGDLFFDLFYVGAFYNLGNILVDNPSPMGILYFLGCFFSVIEVWNQKLMYDSQFAYGDDIFHKVFEAVVLVVLATNVSSIATVERLANPSQYVDMFSFALSRTLLSLLNCGRYLECYWVGRGQRERIKHVTMAQIQYQLLPLCLLIAATIVAGLATFGNEDYNDKNRRGLAGEDVVEAYDCNSKGTTHIPIILLLVAYFSFQLGMIVRVLFIYPRDGSHKKFTIPMNIDFVIHRNGELTMLVLGESILSLIIVDGEQGNYNATFYFGIITVVILQLLHFQSQPHDANAHAMRRHKNAGILYGQTYPIYSAALIAVGASYKLMMYAISKEDKRRVLSTLVNAVGDESRNRWLAGEGDSGCGPYGKEKEQMVAHLFSWAMTIVFLCMDVMQLAHVGIKEEVEKCKLYGETCKRTGKTKIHYNIKGLLFVFVPRVSITIFVLTISLWNTDPRTLAALGFASVTCQLITRFLGTAFFPSKHLHSHGHGHHGGVSDDEEFLSEGDIGDSDHSNLP